jgi:hypothetical protein
MRNDLASASGPTKHTLYRPRALTGRAPMPTDELTDSERDELEDLAERDDRMGKIARAWLAFEDDD